jgi:hypothetical protein
MVSTLRRALFLAVVAAGGAASAQPVTLLHFNSEPGDYIGQGQQFTLTPLDGTITAAHTLASRVEVEFDSDDEPWYLVFAAPAGASLTPGIYEGATRWPFQSSTTPGLDVSGGSRGCNTLTGRFVVHEALYGAGGQVLRFAADYEQHCEGGAPALFGFVRYESSVTLGPRLSVGPASLYEGDAGSTNLRVTISLSAPASALVTVDYTTADGTAVGGSDYTPVSGTAAFPPGATTFVVEVPVRGDTVEEGDETFTLSLGTPAGAPIAFGQGVLTIRNEDPYHTLIHFNSEAGDYIGGGQEFTLTRDDGTITAEPISGGVHVEFNGADSWDLYFVPPAGSTLTPGVYEDAGDWPFQPPGSPGIGVFGAGRGCTGRGRFVVHEAEYGLSGEVLRFALDYEQRCGISSPALFGVVRHNSGVPVVRVSLAGAAVVEGDSGTAALAFPLSLEAASSGSTTIKLRTQDGTAISGSDYAPLSASVTIPAGQTELPVAVQILGDRLRESDETLFLRVAPGPYVSAGAAAVGTILNDDPQPGLSVNDVSILEGAPGDPALATFTVSLSAPSAQTVSVSYATLPGSAGPDDFTPISGVVQLAPGDTSATVSAPLLPDLQGEADETFSLLLSSPGDALLLDDLGVATILDDDEPLGFHLVAPCRLLDTRQGGTALAGGTTLTFAVGGGCGIPATAKAVALTLASVAPTDDGHLALYPAGSPPPATSIVNFARARTKAGTGMARLGAAGRLTLRAVMPAGSAGVTHAVVDVYGYFE